MAASVPVEHEQAIARFESYAAQDPENCNILVTLGDLYHLAGRLETASETYRKVVALDPDNLVARSRLAGVQITRHEFVEAEQTLRTLIDRGETDPAVQHNLGLALFYQKRFDEALAALEQAAASGTDLPRNLAFRAFALHHLGQMDRALDCARAWAQRESTTESHGYLSLVEMDRGDLDAARHRAAAVLEQEPDNPDAGVVVGTAMLENQEMERAAYLFRRMVGKDDQNPRAWLGLGLIYLYQQQFQPAIEAIQRAVALMPENGGARVTLGWAHLLNRDLDSSERVFREAVERHRTFNEAHGGYASVLALRGRKEEAREAIRRAMALDRATFGSVFAHSILLEQEGKREQATRLVEKAMSRELRPGAPTLIEAVQTYARREAARGLTGTPKPGVIGGPTPNRQARRAAKAKQK